METRYRNPNETPAAPATPAGDPNALAEMRERGRALADVADAAIDRALSSDSQRFLRSSRQQGGQ